MLFCFLTLVNYLHLTVFSLESGVQISLTWLWWQLIFMLIFERLEWKLAQYAWLVLFPLFRKACTKLILCIRDLSDEQIKLVNRTTGVRSKETLYSPYLPHLFFGIIFFLPISSRPKASKFTSLCSILKKERKEGVGGESKRDKRNKQF